jgi:glycosyltransferase involved in cell wall biosynthesis
MKLLLFIHSLQCGGAERVTANLANDWAARGWPITLVTLASRDLDFYHLHPAVTRISLDQAEESHGGLAAAIHNMRRVLALRKVLRAVRPDVALGMMSASAVLLILAGLGIRASRVIACEHVYPPMVPVGKAWSALRRWAYPLAEQVTMLTSEGLSWLNEHVPAARGFVIPNPVPFPLPIAEPRLDPAQVVGHDRKVLLAVGRLAQQKGFDWLLAAFSRVADANRSWDLVILGEGSERAALEARIGELGLGYRVFLPGRAGNIGDWYARADLYAMSSRFEGFPNTLGEAMAYGCAAVSYDCDTGPRDIIRDGIDGVLVRPVGDVGALAAALGTLMRDDELRARMSREAVTVRERYSMHSVLAMWDRLLELTPALPAGTDRAVQ